MKRDMELVRNILIALNENENGFATDKLNIEGFSDEQIGYHSYLLAQAGLIQAIENTSVGATSPTSIPQNLTWHGHEFIENAKNDNVWSQTKQAVSKMGDVSFSVWANVLSQVVINNLNINS